MNGFVRAAPSQFAMVCTSHSPLLNIDDAAPRSIVAEIRECTAAVARFVTQFQPDLIVQFGDDHASGFNLGLMPSFCVGLRAEALGDFGTSSGPLMTDETAARSLVESLFADGIDVAFSYRMEVDHGIVQAQDLIVGGIREVPSVPIIINCGGELRPPMARVAALGRAVGAWLGKVAGRRVLLLASGGLSHDPPLPEFQRAAPDVQERIIAGTRYTPALLAARATRVHEAAIDFAGPNANALLPLDPEWDQWILGRVLTGDTAALASLDDEVIRDVGGRGGAEIRNWLAVLAAMDACAGGYRAELDYYRAVPELICGYAIVHGRAPL